MLCVPILLFSQNIGNEEGTKVLSFNVLNSAECLLTVGYPSLQYVRLASFSLRTGEVVWDFSGTRAQFYDNMIKVAVGAYNGKMFAAVINGTKTLFVQDLTKQFNQEQ